MDAHERAAGAPLNGDPGPRDPDAIRREIEQHREELGETVAALAEKADVKARAREQVDGMRQHASERVHEAAGRVREATPDSAAQAAERARAHPIALVVAAAVLAGFVVGRLSAP